MKRKTETTTASLAVVGVDRQGGISPRWTGHQWNDRVSPEDQAVEPQRCV